jgi:hypothetical protein
MPDAPADTTTTTTTEPVATTTGTGDASREPKLDGPFDEQRALRLIANLREENASLRTKSTAPATAPTPKPKDGEDPRVTELENRLRAAEKRDAERAAAELRSKVAESHGVPVSLLTAADEAALTEQAKAISKFAEDRSATPLRGRPRAQLVPGTGATGGDGEGFDPTAVAKAAHRG